MLVACAAIAGVFAQTPIPNRPDGYKIGQADAPIIIDGFFDLLCPDSAAVWPTIKQVVQAYGSKNLQFIMHTFPLPYHYHAFIANQGAHVVNAYAPEKIWAYTDFMFNQQANFWNAATMDNTTNEVISTMASMVESNKILDAKTFTAGIANDTLNYETRVSWKYGCSRGVTGTPNFFVNGVFVDADSSWALSDWQTLINPILNPASQTQAVESPRPAKKMGGRHLRKSNPFTFVEAVQTNNTCPPKQTECNYAPKKFECCLAGENCIPNVGCRCLNAAQC